MQIPNKQVKEGAAANMKYWRKQSDETGNTTLYALVFLPIALSLAAVAIDVSAWYSLRDDVQHYADGLALQAANFLPDQQAALAFIESAAPPPQLSGLSARGFLPVATQLSIGADLTLRFNGTLSTLLPGFSETAFRIERKAVAELVPGDYMLVVADGSTLRPGLRRRGSELEHEAPWGNDLDWPASGYFNCAVAPDLESAQWNWAELWNDSAFRRWATQSCFNPVLSPLKLGTIALIDEISAAGENRLGMIVSPGDDAQQGFTTLQRLRRESFGSGGKPRSPVVWTGYVEGERLLGDEVCMLFSEPDAAFTDRFLLPFPQLNSSQLLENSRCRRPLENPPCGRLHRPSGHMASCLLDGSLALRQAYYWHAARLGLPATPNYPNLPASILEALRQLQDSDLGADRQALERSRGNLAYKSLRKIIVVSDFLPELDAGSPSLRDSLSLLRHSRIALVIVAYRHPGLSADEQEALTNRTTELAAFESGNQGLRTFLASSPEELQRRILPRLLLVDRQLVLRG